MNPRKRFGSFLLGSSVLLGALLMSQSASALSCARPDPAQKLEEVKASPKLYYVLVGRFIALDPPPKNRPPGGYVSPEDQFTPKPPVVSRSLFKGVSLGPARRYDYPLSRFPIDIETSCIGPWCSSPPPPDQKLVAFVEVQPSASGAGQVPVLRLSPCPNYSFPATRETVEIIRRGL